jgi:hypothetical protein
LLGFFFLPKPFLTFPVRDTIAPEMEINIKRIPYESAQVVNDKTHRLERNSVPEVVVTLIGNPKGFCISSQTRLEGQGNRLLIELKKISPESCQKVETPCRPRIRVNKPSSLAVDIMLKRFTNTEIKLAPKEIHYQGKQ